MSSIVFFGQADAGKSTLAGYIISRYEKYFRLSAFIESMKKDNPKYDTALAFSSIINTNKDEVRDTQHQNSRSIHLRKVKLPFETVTIIDTPGSERYNKQRERGMYYGNIGVFFMEINNILEHKYDFDTIAPIALWSKLENKRMIFLLTKFDMVNYESEAYNRGIEEVESICSYFGFSGEVTVIPTAIEVDALKNLSKTELDSRDLGENICKKSQKMPWYGGAPLLEAIEKDIQSLDQIDENEPLMFCINDQVDRPNSKSGKIWTIKILSGILKKGQEIQLAPVKDDNNNYEVLTATVKHLRRDLSRFDEQETAEVARKGEIYGMDLKNCYLNKRHVSKGEFNAISSTCGVSRNEVFIMSDTFSFSIKSEDIFAFKDRLEMRLMWFGRSLWFTVRGISENYDRPIITGQLKSTRIAFPISNGGVSETILVKGNGVKDFYNCTLVGIG